jgi:ABC-type antimicrobial peptide transport system permease subunit
VFSIPVSFVLARQLFKVLQLENVPFSYPPQALVIGLIGILLISAISSLGPSMSAARKTVSDILRYQ